MVKFGGHGVPDSEIIIQNDHAFFSMKDQPVLKGSGIIVPFRPCRTPFELSSDEWLAIHDLLLKAKRFIDEAFNPDGYNLGWNCGSVAGQEIMHAHLHVIPRFDDEPYAGRGIRSWLKQKENLRSSKITKDQ